MNYELHHGDCLDILPMLAPQSVDAVIADIPSGRTACAWDSVIPFEPMWKELKRVAKKRAPIVLLGCTQPFTSALVMSNLAMFKYDWVWRKNTPSGHGNARRMPMRYHESILVFGGTTYNPQPHKRFSAASEQRCRTPVRNSADKSRSTGMFRSTKRLYESLSKGPESVLDFHTVPNAGGAKLHPTQKPLALLEYLVKTYTNAGDLVLDFTMGSGTCGHVCGNLGRRFVGIEKDAEYFNLASERIATAYAPLRAMQGVAV